MKDYVLNAELVIESMLHVLRDCPTTVETWNRIVPHGEVPCFFISSKVDWIIYNLGNNKLKFNHIPWNVVFGIVCWFMWKWRNSLVFGRKMLAAAGRLNSIISLPLLFIMLTWLIEEMLL